jgi:hypothetical protein BATR1942_14910
MRILITGIAGYVGRRFAEKATSEGSSTLGIDIVSPPTPGAWLRADLTDPNFRTRSVFEGVDAIVHMAAVVGVQNADQDAERTRRSIVATTATVLRMAKEFQVKRVCFLSSSEVYGQGNNRTLTEASPLAPVTEYGLAKQQAERLIYEWALDNPQAQTTVVRPFNLYGPHQSNRFVVPRFVEQCLNGRPIQIVGDGTQTRTFTHIDDFIDGLWLAINRDTPRHAIYNICGDDFKSIHDLAELVISTAGRGTIEYRTASQLGRPATREIVDRRGSHTLATKDLGYRPTRNLRTSLPEIIRQNMNVAV